MPSSPLPKRLETWNRKLHMYTGLYFLLFIWLFAFSGLLLNHPKWETFQFWQHRNEQTSTHTLPPIVAVDDFARAEEIARGLGLVGEIEAVLIIPEENQFRFRVLRPGNRDDVSVNLSTKQAKLRNIKTNTWGVMRYLHQFNGVNMENAKEKRDWYGTTLWTVAMDALCFGLAFLTLSSLYMWYQLKRKRVLGMAVLGAGVFCCAFFAIGL